MNEFDKRIRETTGRDLHSADISTIQVNVGLRCNQECSHCHVAASPKRKEEMSWETMELIIDAAKKTGCGLVDITGGSPELNPNFRRFVETLDGLGIPVMVRTNLTVLLTPGMETIPGFYRDHTVQLVASLPCYLEENVDRQRGAGVYRGSIEAIKTLNKVRYGRETRLPLSLVYNPIGPHLPPNQSDLEADYRRELKERFDIDFTNLITITNMPIGRYVGDLRKQNKFDDYMRLLKSSFNPVTINGLMCRHQINVDWDGNIYDCDFNLALKLSVDHGAPSHIRNFDPATHAKRRIVTGNHCFGCTAGCGSSCGGAIL
ncbi:MAG: arsenosugar biosynthesis radical SAM protein ArsS [Candidatus Latescibacterota bacterium]|nr:MAG: arsenosugar biosynthesis radical SAM protein ArsS [Candidatus Latescibacterota bacterium]